ncbi:MAG: hypothetical protein V4662_24935 [Verrucomicrobiota bacterium]
MHLLTQRIKLSTVPVVSAASLTLDFFRGAPLRLECAAFTSSDIASMAGVSSVTLLMKKERTDKDSAALMAKTVAAADFTSATAAQWVAGTHEQFAFDLSAAECNLDLGTDERKVFWLVFKALLSSGSTVVLGCGFATCYEANQDPVGDPPENPGSAFSQAEADARFVRFDGEQELTEDEQDQAKANLGLDGPLGVTDHGALTGLADDDHPQYHNDVRGDARYSLLGHGHADKADLVGGVIPTSQIPAIAITTFLGTVASQGAMLALSGQSGDWCNRSDTSTAWVIVGNNPTQLASWGQINYPASPVTSVNGQSGVIVLGYANVGAPPATRLIASQSSITGGGTLEANRTLSLVNDTPNPGPYQMYGTTLGGSRSWLTRPHQFAGTLYGHTDPGSDAVPPALANMTLVFYSDNQSGDVNFEVNGSGIGLLSVGDSGTVPSVENSDSGEPRPPSQVCSDFVTAFNFAFGGYCTATIDGGDPERCYIEAVNAGDNFRIYQSGSLQSLGASYDETAYYFAGSAGADPSGGLFFVNFPSGTKPLRVFIRGIDDLGSGVSLVRVTDDEVVASSADPVASQTLELIPNGAQLYYWQQGGSFRLQINTSDLVGGSVYYVVTFLE